MTFCSCNRRTSWTNGACWEGAVFAATPSIKELQTLFMWVERGSSPESAVLVVLEAAVMVRLSSCWIAVSTEAQLRARWNNFKFSWRHLSVVSLSIKSWPSCRWNGSGTFKVRVLLCCCAPVGFLSRVGMLWSGRCKRVGATYHKLPALLRTLQSTLVVNNTHLNPYIM